ncbi:MAG TPA: sugar transferase [Actinomycetaceae bacterium]|nr:sugar transferase [Actinomycetaceae bacterium]
MILTRPTSARARAAEAARRTHDVLVACVGIAALAPVWAAIAAAIVADSDGPVLFLQERVGRNGTLFQIHKFRTMCYCAGGPGVAAFGDTRVTRVGRFLRASKLDETPQLLDVLRGDMSLVGPRPELPQYVALWPEEQRARILSVRPGITDPVSVALRDEAVMLANCDEPERTYIEQLLSSKARGYAEYVACRSILGDLRILTATVFAVVQRPHEVAAATPASSPNG